jgi:hypothetical protein
LRKTAESLITESKTYRVSTGQYKRDTEINTQRLYKHYPDSVSLNAKQVSATYKKVATKSTVLPRYEIFRTLPSGQINRKTASLVTHGYEELVTAGDQKEKRTALENVCNSCRQHVATDEMWGMN